VSIVANRRPVSSYRPPLRTRDLPLPPRWTPREKAIAQKRLTQFVVLSMLLHAIAIMLFGAPVGGSREGRAMFGSLNVVIREAYRATTAPKEVSAPPAPAAKVEAPQPASAPPPPTPAPVPPTPAPQAQQAVELPPAELPPMMDKLAPSEIKIEPTVDFKPLPVETPKIPQPLLRPMPTLPERSTLPPLETPVIRVPAETPRIPSQLLQPMPTIQERATLPPVQTPVIRIPVETPSIPAPLLQPISPLQERATLPPVERMPDLATPPPVPQPTVREPLPPPPAATTRTPVPPPPVAREPVAAPPAETRVPPAEIPRAPPSTDSRPAPTETPSFRTAPPASREAPSDYDPTKPSLNLDEMRKRAAEITRSGTGNRALLPFPMPPVEKPKTNMEKAIENARKPDCNDAYKGLGLLAVVPLIANEFGEGTCRWR
jgi:hypothetical protein